MRAMLVANFDVPHAFANGSLGRVVHWGPEVVEDGRPRRQRTLLANVPGVQVRFYKESAFQSNKKHFLPEVDFLDIAPRREAVAGARGQPSMLQLQLLAAYALTIHKVQALTLRDKVLGCLEGVFALGQIYVLVSRVIDPMLFLAVGLPPEDLLDDVARAWADEGWRVDELLQRAASVTGEWCYTPCATGEDPCDGVRARLSPTYEERRRVPLKLKSLADILNPQPETASVLSGVLDWISRADVAAQRGEPKPPI